MNIRKKATKKYKRTACLLSVLVVFIVSGCARTSYPSKEAVTQEEGYDAVEAPAAENAALTESGMDYGSTDTGAGMEYGSTDTGAGMQEDAYLSGRKLIKEVSMEVETEAYEQLMTTVTEQISALGGYIESSYTAGGQSGGKRYGEVSARIPKEQLEAFITAVEGASSVRYKRETVEDVTLQYVDLESHKKALMVEQERLLELISLAESVEDIITIEGRLSQVRYQLESMESQLRTYDNRIDYSTVYLSIAEVIRLSPATGEQIGMWERIRIGFMENVYNLKLGMQDLAVSFLINTPYLFMWLVIIALLISVVVLFVRHMRRKAFTGDGRSGRRRQKRQQQEVQQPQEVQQLKEVQQSQEVQQSKEVQQKEIKENDGK